jgi:hypothetical protein
LEPNVALEEVQLVSPPLSAIAPAHLYQQANYRWPADLHLKPKKAAHLEAR